MTIHTVTGTLRPEELGPTSMHEHVFIDSTVWHTPPQIEELPTDPRVSIENLGFIRYNVDSLKDNLTIDNPELAVEELSAVVRAGGAAIVDVTVIGLGRTVGRLPEIARRTGLQIMVGCGVYVDASHPPEIRRMDEEQLLALLLRELRNGIEDTGIRPALVGEIGTSSPPTEAECRVLRAAGKACAETGATISVHFDHKGQHGLEVVRILLDQGMQTERIILGHMDVHTDWGYHRAVAETGVILEYDTFGSEVYFTPTERTPTDLQRLELVDRLLGEGRSSQLVVACDVWNKSQLRAFGGAGYDHLFRRIVPMLRGRGVDEKTINTILIDNPRRLLDR